MGLPRMFFCSAVLVALLAAGPDRAASCSPPVGGMPDLTKAERAHHAESILVGKIVSTVEDSRFNYGGDSAVYTALMKVYCIYKGDITANKVNITQVGAIPGMCHSTKLEEGSEYVVYLSGTENRINDVEIENTAEHRYNVSRACGLKLRYPDGISADDLPHQCPEPAPEDDCVGEYVYEIPTVALPEAPEAPEAPGAPGSHDPNHEGHEHEGHDHDHEGHDHEGHDHEGHDHEGHDHEGHDHEGHDHEGHDHEGHEHEGHDHEGHEHEGHEHENTHVKGEAVHGQSSQCRASSSVLEALLLLLLGVTLSL